MNRGAVLVVLLSALVAWGMHAAREQGRAEGRGEVVQARVDTLTQVVRVTDTVYRRDTLRLRVAVTQWDSIRVTDTLVREQVVYVPRAAADTVLAACRLVLRSCEARVAARDSLIHALNEQVRAVQATQPPAWRVWAERGLLLAAGVGVGQLGR
jgi:hypothetical protein